MKPTVIVHHPVPEDLHAVLVQQVYVSAGGTPEYTRFMSTADESAAASATQGNESLMCDRSESARRMATSMSASQEIHLTPSMP